MTAMNVSRTNEPGGRPKSQNLLSGEKAGQPDRAASAVSPEPSRIAERAYELYVQRDRQDGQALEDWLKAEQQLLDAACQK